MKLKQAPEDFQVEELTAIRAGNDGAFALYRLDKTGWTTLDALGVVRRRWNIPFQRLSYGGLKDRHAVTTQYFTILRGPRRNLNQQNICITYLGNVLSPYVSQDIEANRFRLTLRALTTAECEAALAAIPDVSAHGLPNYFDDQRFGSVGGDGEFIARLMVLQRYEEALKQALVGPYEFDRAEQKREKAILTAHWGDWKTCKEQLPRGHARSLVDYLCSHGTNFRGALERLRPELRGLYLSAYQSAIWNRTLDLALRRTVEARRLRAVELRLGKVAMYTTLTPTEREALAELQLPLASARLKLPEDDARLALVREVLQTEGFPLEEMKLRGFEKVFFSRGDRAALCVPQQLSGMMADDERQAGRRKLELSFDLPRGSYATLVVKRLLA